jgi:SAM-dependent methyltransferase
MDRTTAISASSARELLSRRVAALARLPGRLERARRALEHAAQAGAPGVRFARYGRRLGVRLLVHRSPGGYQYVVAPVNIMRYYEFEFADRARPDTPGRALDVSSPRLFPFYLAEVRRCPSVTLINPDESDLALSRDFALRLGIRAIHTASMRVEALADLAETYEYITSISVVEHVAGDDGDSAAMRAMYSSLAPGGRLVVTIPVDRHFRLEYRPVDYYGTSGPAEQGGSVFFQRLYDQRAIEHRITAAVGCAPTSVGWFGERVAGTFVNYEREWMRQGLDATIEDPRRIADDYREYPDWESMPGVGVCALAFDKPAPERS